VQEKVRVRVPEGADNGDVIRLRGRGHQSRSNGVPDADLLLELVVAPVAGIVREQLDLIVPCTIEPIQALMGATVEVNLLGKALKVRVPEGVRSGQRLRLKGQGVRRSGATGDAQVEVLIDGRGRKLTDAQREAASALWELLKS
jgi:DnaJ-class molecular chaperone